MFLADEALLYLVLGKSHAQRKESTMNWNQGYVYIFAHSFFMNLWILSRSFFFCEKVFNCLYNELVF